MDGQCMSIAVALAAESKSFEERRIEDYIKAYQATGQQPLPCPQEPTDEHQRLALKLPPLFKPQTMPAAGPSTTAPSKAEGSSTKPNTNPENLPKAQEFRLISNGGERYYNISAMPEYEGFSFEELRAYAYKHGHKTPPITITMSPFDVKQSAPVTAAPSVPSVTPEDKLQSTYASPPYDKHSPEELRIAYLLAGRELTSAEIVALQHPVLPPPNPAPLSAPPPAPISLIPPPIYPSTSASTSAAPSAPKFTFGLR